jgi:hypothetical protein
MPCQKSHKSSIDKTTRCQARRTESLQRIEDYLTPLLYLAALPFVVVANSIVVVVVVCICHDNLFVQKDAAAHSSSSNNSALYLCQKHAMQLGRASIAGGASLSGTALASNGSTESYIVLGGGNPKREWLGRQGGGQVHRHLPTPMPTSSS